MKDYNVALWFAKNENSETVTVDKLNEDYKGKYYCPLCGSEVIPKAMDSDCVSPHFAHIDRSKCSGESMIHWWVKNELIKIDGIFEVTTTETKQYMCKSIDFEKFYDTPSGKYKPDITVTTYCGETLFVEVNFTNNKKAEEYWNKWEYLNNTVVEFNVKDLYCEDGNKIKVSNIYRAIYYNGKEFDISSKDFEKYKNKIFKEVPQHLKEKLQELEWFVNDIYRYNSGIMILDDLIDNFMIIARECKNYDDSIVYLYKNNKCQNAITDIISNIEQSIWGVIERKVSNVSNTRRKWSILDNRLIYERIWGNKKVSVKVPIDEYKYTLTYDDVSKNITLSEFDKIKDYEVAYQMYIDFAFNIKKIATEGLDKYIDSLIHLIDSAFVKNREAINKLKMNEMELSKIKNDGYISKGKIVENIQKRCETYKEYVDLQNKHIRNYDEKLYIDEIIKDKLSLFKGNKINNVLMYDDDNIENEIINTIHKSIEVHKTKYLPIIHNYIVLKKEFKTYSQKDGYITFEYEGKKFKTNLLDLYYEDIKVANLTNSKCICSEIKNIIKAIVGGLNSHLNSSILNLVGKIKNRYESINANYKVIYDLVGITLYKTNDEWGLLNPLCYYKYKNNMTEEDIINQFSNAIRNYLYGGSN